MVHTYRRTIHVHNESNPWCKYSSCCSFHHYHITWICLWPCWHAVCQEHYLKTYFSLIFASLSSSLALSWKLFSCHRESKTLTHLAAVCSDYSTDTVCWTHSYPFQLQIWLFRTKMEWATSGSPFSSDRRSCSRWTCWAAGLVFLCRSELGTSAWAHCFCD